MCTPTTRLLPSKRACMNTKTVVNEENRDDNGHHDTADGDGDEANDHAIAIAALLLRRTRTPEGAPATRPINFERVFSSAGDDEPSIMQQEVADDSRSLSPSSLDLHEQYDH